MHDQMINTPELPPPFEVKLIHLNPFTVKTPGKMWGVHTDHEILTVFSHMNTNFVLDKSVKFSTSLKPEVFINQKAVEFSAVKDQKELEDLLRKVSHLRPCIGYSDGVRSPQWTEKCTGCVTPGVSLTVFRCLHCRVTRRALQKRKRTERKNNKREQTLAHKLKISKQMNRRRKRKILSLTQRIHQHMELQKVKISKRDEIIETLPPEQQPLVRTCFENAKRKLRGRRYTVQWLYDTLLMKIQSRKLYRRLRRDNKLPLPSESTLLRLIKKIRPVYGFSENLFAALKQNSSGFASDAEKHGCLLIDEMSLEEAVSFQPHTFQTCLVDLGKFTPQKMKNKRGDHALVVMFQPYRGQWVQALRAFLSAGAVPGETLQKIILEAIILMECNGYFVDGVTTDGASWNRVMWDLFGISKESNKCQHPVDSERELHFASDFPHLIKNLWVRIATKKEIDVPEGTVRLAHWEAVLKEESRRAIKRGYTITTDHLDPTNYQKMNVRMAMRFFGNTVLSAMISYRAEGVPELQDSEPSIALIGRMNQVIDAMNSQIPCEALRPNPESKHQRVLRDFIQYLEQMEENAQTKRIKETEIKRVALNKASEARRQAEEKEDAQNGKKKPHRRTSTKIRAATPLNARKVSVGGEREFTSSTFLGLWVTVRSALSLCDYLCSKVGFIYLMSRKMNQDALEHFFGHVRGACGSNSHPDAVMFINVFRLLSTYSLVKPPRGSNVSGADMMNTLLSLDDVHGKENESKRKELEDKIDLILDGGLSLDDTATDHEYLEHTIDPLALTVLGGYVSRKLRSMKPCSVCEECFKSVCAPPTQEPQEREALLTVKSYGGLLSSSDALFGNLYELESTIVKVTSNTTVHTNLFFSILDAMVASSNDFVMLGCNEHKRQLTSAMLTFYLTCRMHFLSREINKTIAVKKKRKDMSKMAKLIHSSEAEKSPPISGINENR